MQTRLTAAAIVVLATAAAVLTGCAAPSGGTTVTQGSYSGEYSVLNSPVTYGYDGVAGQTVNLLLYDNRPFFNPNLDPPRLDLIAPGGAVVPVASTRGTTRIYELPVTGRYSVALRYPSADLGVLTYTLAVSQDQDRGATGLGPIAPIGSLIPGQAVTYTYAGTAGEHLNRFLVDDVVAPDGTSVPPNGRRTSQVTLPVTGNYRIEVTQTGATLSNDLPAVPVDLGPTSVPTLLPGQHVSLLYTATAGETIGLSSTFNVGVQLRNADETVFDPTEILPRTRYTFTDAGTYQVVVRGSNNSSGAFVWLSETLDLGVLEEGSYPTPGRLPGQAAAAGVVADAGGRFRIRTFDPPGVKPGVTVRSPNGSILEGVVDEGPPFDPDPWVTFTATESGVHSVLVVPRSVGVVPGSDLITLEIDALP